MSCTTLTRSFLLLLVAAPAAHAQVFTVGPDPGCTTSSIQAAINAASDNYTIRITRGATYTAQALLITGKDLTLAGGYETCASAAPSGISTLSGQGGANDSVLTIRGGSSVVLRDLAIVRGDEVYDGYGGGIDYRGFGDLILENVGVAQNYAGYGGGVSVIADGADVSFSIRQGTVIQLNTAQFSGGGVRTEGPVSTNMVEPDTSIYANEALGINPTNNQPQYGNGGGLQVIASGRAFIGSPGYANFGAIANNRARYGGGIAIDGSESTPFSAYVSIFSTDSARPTRISGNRATQTGGGIHLLPEYSGQIDNFFSRAILCLWDARIEDNRAQQGAAIYGDSDLGTFGADLGSGVYMNRSETAGDCAQPPGFAERCASPPCTVFAGNRAVDANDQRTNGAVVLLQYYANFRLRNAVFRNNVATEAIRVFGPFSHAFEQLLVVDNDLAGPAIRLEDSLIRTFLRDSTIANNTMASSPVVSINGDVTLERFLVAQPGRTVLATNGSRTIVDVLANEIASLGGGPEAQLGIPRFTDPAHGDYMPIAASAAVDFATQTGATQPDLLGAAREVDLPLKADLRGTRDAGAIERQSVGNLVLNGEFVPRSDGDELRLWAQGTTPNIATWSASEGAAGGAGAVLVAYDPAIDPGGRPEPEGGAIPRVGLRQCVNLPGPATYSLNAWTKVPGTIAANRDYPRLHWVLRNSSENCSGAPDAEGDVFLQRSNNWTTGAPGEIQLAPGAWTSNSTLEVSLVVYDGDLVGTNLVDAFFDRVELRVSSLEVRDVFKDGFE